MTFDGPGGGVSAVKVRAVSKSYGEVKALKNVSLDIASGKIVALIGPNGAGKSTFVEILMGLRVPESGDVFVLGNDVIARPKGHVKKIGVQLQETKLFLRLTAREYLKFFSRLYDNPLKLSGVADRLQISQILDKPIRNLSGGQRQRVGLALAIINDPDLIILDEPTAGLDPIARREFWALLRSLNADGKTILFSTHYMDEAHELASEIVMIANGEVVAQGTAQQLIAATGDPKAADLDEAYEYYANRNLGMPV